MRALGACALLFAMIVAACDSTVTEADIQKWSNNEIGVRRLKEVVVDAKQPRGTRIRALEVLVEKRLASRVKPMIQEYHEKLQNAVQAAKREVGAQFTPPRSVDVVTADTCADKQVAGSGACATIAETLKRQDDAKVLARELVAQLEQHVQKNSAFVLNAKDTILELVKYLSPEDLDKAQRIISAWAFSDITWDTPPREVRQKIEKRMSANQIVAMGKYATQIGGILLANGFVVDQMLHFLVALRTPEAFDLVAKGLRSLEAKIGVRTTDVAALRAIGTPAGAAMLFEIYQNPTVEEELRANAYNFAVEMIELPEVKKQPAEVAAQLVKIMGGSDPDDRWSGAANLVRLLGPAAKIEDLLAAFKDDGVYQKGTDEAGKSVMDFCLDLYDMKLKATATPVLRDRLTNGNRIQKAIAILCLKALGVNDANEDLKTLTTNLDKPEDVAVDDFLGGKVTLAKLAQNALDGLAAIERIDADKAAGKLNEEQHKTKRLGAVVEYELIGEEFAKAVEDRYNEWLKEQTNPKPPDPKTPPPPGGAAPGTPPAPGTPGPGTPKPP